MGSISWFFWMHCPGTGGLWIVQKEKIATPFLSILSTFSGHLLSHLQQVGAKKLQISTQRNQRKSFLVKEEKVNPKCSFGLLLVSLLLRNSASSFHWLSSSIFNVCRSSRIRDTSSHLHYMMFQTIQTIHFLWGYDPGNMSVSFIAELSSVYCCLVL